MLLIVCSDASVCGLKRGGCWNWEERIYSFVFTCLQFMPQQKVAREANDNHQLVMMCLRAWEMKVRGHREIRKPFSWGSFCFIGVHVNNYSTTLSGKELGKEAVFHNLPLLGRGEPINRNSKLWLVHIVHLTRIHFIFCLPVVRYQIQAAWVLVLSSKTLHCS